MNTLQYNTQDMLIRTVAITAKHPTILSTPAATALVPTISAGITKLDDLRGQQVSGSGELHGGVKERRQIAKELRLVLLDVAQNARILAKGPNPGLDAQLHMPRKPNYSQLLGTGDSFVEVLTPAPMKAAFVDRGFAPTFVADLSALVAKFRAATERKYGGLNEQVQGTNGLTVSTRAAVAAVRDLDAIVSPALRDSDPALYASWKAAIHIARPPRRKGAKNAKAVNGDQEMVNGGSAGAVASSQSGASSGTTTNSSAAEGATPTTVGTH